MSKPQLRLIEASFHERPVKLRLPFRFGVITLTEAPQVFVRARIKLADGREGEGVSAELLVPKWFDKSPALTNEDNFDQLRRSLKLARGACSMPEPTRPSVSPPRSKRRTTRPARRPVSTVWSHRSGLR